ncbi:MAG: NADPH-quinone oxidoreductase [Ignavibacteria bacterium]|nr:MAG: NADPH-quinone oxidoreductase [Ignavibacteria bacterium]
MSGYFKDIYDGIATAMVGMKITWGHLFTKSVTIQYPDVKHDIPERVRNRLYVNMDDCIGCDQCAKVCPVNCITIETAKSLPTEDLGETSTGNKKKLWVTKFDIDIGKCCYCGLCVFPCPTYCIFMTDVFEFSEYKREDLIYKFATLTEEEAAEKTANAVRQKQEQEEKKKAALEAKKKAEEESKAAEKQKPETGENEGADQKAPTT